MKILWAIPKTHNIQAIVNSLEYAEPLWDIQKWFLDAPNPPELSSFKPDVMIYIGAVSGPACIENSSLIELKKKTKIISLVVNGCDRNIDDVLQSQINENCFNLIVGLDGTDEFPHRQHDLVLLPPIDPRPFENESDIKKDILCGFTSEISPGRFEILKDLGHLVSQHQRDVRFGIYQPYADFMMRCKFWLNLNFAQSNEIPRSVNQKMMEAGYARCIFLERKGAFANRWFIPGVDYLEFETASDIRNFIINFKDFHMTSILSDSINRQYSASHFWTKVFRRLNECA